MKTWSDANRFSFSSTRILLAGLAGGLAEVLWVMTWSALTPLQAVTIAREVTATVFPGMAGIPMAVEIGLLIHFLISLAFAVIFVWAFGKRLPRHYGGAGILAASVALLVLDWTINFLVLLPAINPAFVALMPTAVTLTSKILFGFAMGAVLIARPQPLNAIQKLRVTG